MESEYQKAQDERVENLWQTLDTYQKGYLSLQGLKSGLKKLDHREYTATSSKGVLTICQLYKMRTSFSKM